jgi:uncharacterized RDD family membrane protein YckC
VKDARREGSPYPKADLTLRGLARLVDLTLAFVVANAAQGAGPALAALYLLAADGLMQGQSVGKRIFGVRTMVLPPRGATRGVPAGYRESVLRNAPFALLGLFYGLTLVGWLLLVLIGIPVVAFEAYMVWTDRYGLRIGDIFADTQVVDAKVASKDALPTTGDLRTAAPPAPTPRAISRGRRAA